MCDHRWAWADIDIIFGDLMRYMREVPTNASVVCPIYPNSWGVTTWGPFTAFRLSAPNATEIFRYSSRWRQVLVILVVIHYYYDDL